MTALPFVDFYNPPRDTDSSRRVVQIYRNQFPDLYRVIDHGELKTSSGSTTILAGDTLITYKSAIRRIYGKYFSLLDEATQRYVKSSLEIYSYTAEKQIQCWDGATVINNHQIGNMMPFPSSIPSLNSIRADVLKIPVAPEYDFYRDIRQRFFGSNAGKPIYTEKLYDYFDRFLAEVKNYYVQQADFVPKSELQIAIYYQCDYFDFFRTYDGFVEGNLLQDFVDIDLWAITDFREYLQVASDIIDNRGRRFTATAEHR